MENKYTVCKEEVMVKEIKKLYESMIHTSDDEKEYKAKLATQLLSYQKEDGSFRVIDTLMVDGDIRVCYGYVPSYYATAALINCKNAGALASELEPDFVRGLEFAVTRKLMGHGYGSISGLVNALDIYM